MHTSGIVIVPAKGFRDGCCAAVEAKHGVQIMIALQTENCLVAVLESETLQEQEDLLRSIQALPEVALAELVCHYFGDEVTPVRVA